MNDVLKIFKALADETRLRIFRILTSHELNVNEIVDVLQMGQSRISRHLKILADCRLLNWRRDGSFVYYQAEQDEDKRLLMAFISRYDRDTDKYSTDLQRSEIIVADRKQRTRSFFSRMAASWDDLKREIFGDFNLNRALFERFPRVDTAVDLGCGTGDLLSFMAEKADTAIGVDSSPEMLALAKKRLGYTGEKCDFRLGEIEHLPIKNREADFAVINMVLQHIAVPAAGIVEANRILKPGGILLIADLDKHNSENVRERFGGQWMGFAKKEIEKWLTDADFTVTDLHSYKVRLGLYVNVFTAEKTGS